MQPEEQDDVRGPAAGGGELPADDEEEDRRPSDDWDWAMTDPEVRARYGGKIVAVNRRTVWGAGDDEEAALDAALGRPGCPNMFRLTFVYVIPDDPTSWREP